MKVPWFFLSLVAVSVCLFAGYEFKDIEVRPAGEYASRQDFQDIAIGAKVYRTEAETSEIFDTKKLSRNRIMAVLVVIDNRNDFDLGLRESEIFLVTGDGVNLPTLPMS